jgi:crossover junction endodeoxyribonuclease RuvC
MLVIGIDPGTARTGFGLVQDGDGGQLVAVEYGVISTPSGLSVARRLQMLYDQLKAVLSLHRPESSAVEQIFFQRNVKTALSVGQARGVVLLALTQAGLPVAEYSPLQVKQAVAGYGNADKRQMQQMVKALLHLETIPRPDDAADALGVAICHLHTLRTQRAYQRGMEASGADAGGRS